MPNYNNCSICLEDINDSSDKHVLEPCKHVFHTLCLISSLRKCGPKCPNCRGVDPLFSNSSTLDMDDEILVSVSRWGQPFEPVLRRSDIINITNENIDISNIEIFDISSNLIELK